MIDLEDAVLAELKANKPVYHRLASLLSRLDALAVALLTLAERRRTL